MAKNKEEERVGEGWRLTPFPSPQPWE